MEKEVVNREFGDLPSGMRQSILNFVHEINGDKNTFLRPVHVIVKCERVAQTSEHPRWPVDVEDFPLTGC